jgi:hypothetical protein
LIASFRKNVGRWVEVGLQGAIVYGKNRKVIEYRMVVKAVFQLKG